MASIPSDSKCLVVGATNPTSIGFITALALLQAGAAHVTVVGRSQPKLDHAITALLSKKKGKISGVLGDLTQPESMEAVVQEASNNMGGLDVLVCCGGNGYSEYLGLDPADLQSYRTMQDVAVLSPMFLIEAAIPFLSKSVNPEGGTVVLVGSVSSNVPWPNTMPHNIAMSAKETMMKNLAFKYRHDNVRINLVSAGVIHTGALDVMAKKKNVSVESYAALRASAQPLGRNGKPEDVANAVMYLASPASGFTIGETIRVDGGLHLSNWWNRQVMLNEYKGGTN